MRIRIKPLADGTTELDIKLLSDGRTLIHWLEECEDGPVVLKGHPRLRETMGRPADGRYRVACRPKQNTVSSQKRGNVRFMCMTSGDPAAVTCPECLSTPAAKLALTQTENPTASQAALEAIKGVNAK